MEKGNYITFRLPQIRIVSGPDSYDDSSTQSSQSKDGCLIKKAPPPRPPPPVFRNKPKPKLDQLLITGKPSEPQQPSPPILPKPIRHPQSQRPVIPPKPISHPQPQSPIIPPKPIQKTVATPFPNPQPYPASTPSTVGPSGQSSCNSTSSTYKPITFTSIGNALSKIHSTLVEEFNPPPPPRPPKKNQHIQPIATPSNLNTIITPSFSEGCLKCQDFSIVDAHAQNFPRQTVLSLQQLSSDLTSPFDTIVERARSIFIWLHYNIVYDTAAFFGNRVRPKSPLATISTGLAVCQGYAELFAELGRYAGIEVIVVTGHGKGYGYKKMGNHVPRFDGNHAWNAFRLSSPSGPWHLIDCCWGAGHLGQNNQYIQKLTANYFTNDAESFRRNHFPENPSYQFCPQQISWQEYILAEEGPFFYGEFCQKGFCKETIQPTKREIFAGSGKMRFLITSNCPHLSIPEQERYVILLSVDGVNTPFQEEEGGRRWSCMGEIKPGCASVSLIYLASLGNENGKGITVQKYLREVNRVGSSYGGLCKWDVVQ